VTGASPERYTVELEPEVRAWLETLAEADYRAIEQSVDVLSEQPTTLGEPRSRHLGEGLRELRVTLQGNAMRVTYWLAPGQRIVLLTVFRKTKMRETREVERAKAVMKECAASHAPAGEHDVYDRGKGSR
jgi:hypothetical protein